MPEPGSSIRPSSTHEQFFVGPEEAGQRLDRYLAERLPELSRTRIQELIANGTVRVAGIKTKRSHAVAAGELVEIEVEPRPVLEALPQPIPIEILYEDEDFLAVNKPAGMLVHAGAGPARSTVVGALLHRMSPLSTVGGPLRPGIVHRLDRSTSGVLLVAKNDAAHEELARQFRERLVQKTYVALVHGGLKQTSGKIQLPVARDLRRRVRMTTRRREGRAALTAWRILMRLDGFTLVEADLHTGRTHQIRVHFSALGHPVVGDTLYGAPPRVRLAGRLLPELGRPFLHAARIRFQHPRRGGVIDVRAPMAQDLCDYLRQLAAELGIEAERIDAAARPYL